MATGQHAAKVPPPFFEVIRGRAREDWQLLEDKPHIAGAWRQLFRQVQSPRHVLSELLQNADDAGAKSASARIDGDRFVFEHDGEDFTEDEFASLCRFAFSNKRSLHTIGFRGIGFKSVFSLGDAVDVVTPSLAVRFHKSRFTEPVWVADTDGIAVTRISITIADKDRRSELERNLNEWAASPASLLFFHSIRRLVINGQTTEKTSKGVGPVPSSEQFMLAGRVNADLIVFRSDAEEFPTEAREEISKERDLTDLNLPPCRVEIVLGLPGTQKLFVVLPTGVELSLPFSCNGPFLQDPARVKIKEPSLSPTNRWLLGRLGALASRSLLCWLENQSLGLAERARAYDLLPPPHAATGSLDSACSEAMQKGVASSCSRGAILLATDGTLTPAGSCIAPPYELYEVWKPDSLSAIFRSSEQHQLSIIAQLTGSKPPPEPAPRGVLAKEVEQAARNTLLAYGWLLDVDTSAAIAQLSKGGPPPKPDSWERLAKLWAFVKRKIQYDWSGEQSRNVRMVPVEGQPYLLAASEVVRLSSRQESINKEDWAFLLGHVHPLDRGWAEFLAGKEKNRAESQPPADISLSLEMLKVLRLHEATAADELVGKACAALFAGKQVLLAECVRITHIVAALNARTPAALEFVTRDRYRRGLSHQLIGVAGGDAETLLPSDWIAAHFLHEDYTSRFTACDARQWVEWVRSERSGLLSFPPPLALEQNLWGRYKVEEVLAKRQVPKPQSDAYKYKRDNFVLHDFDFPAALIQHWEQDRTRWRRVLRLLLDVPAGTWSGLLHAKVIQKGTSYEQPVQCGPIPAAWVHRFRSLPCLQDTHGVARVPSELYLRNPSTDPLVGVEPFVLIDLDTEATKPLLKLLGVKDTPTGLDKLIGRIQALATVLQPLDHIHEIAKWYEALDRAIARADTGDQYQAVAAFREQRLMLTATGTWGTSSEVFIHADEQDVPDALVVHPSVRQLAVWTRLGVAERPTVARVLGWLKGLKPGEKLDAQAFKRVRSALQRQPLTVWNDCGHWLNLERAWVPTRDLAHRVTMQVLARYGDLFPKFREQTADMQMLAADMCAQEPFSRLPNLGDKIELRITDKQQDLPVPVGKPWLLALAEHLRRVKLQDEQESRQVWAVAERLRRTVWQPFHHLRVTPFVDGTPAGPPHSPGVLWDVHTLYVRNEKMAKVADDVIQELGRAFGNQSVLEAMKLCFERDADYVADYMKAHFDLLPAPQPLPGAPQGEGAAQPAVPSPGAQTAAEQGGGVEQPGVQMPQPPAVDLAAAAANAPAKPEREHPKPPAKPPLIARFATPKGFVWDEQRGCYVHPSGAVLRKCEGCFNWEMLDPAGTTVRRFWVAAQNIRGEQIVVAAELWEQVRAQPATSAFVLEREESQPWEMTGAELLRLKDAGRIKLYPAAYRLRFTHDG